MKKYYVVCFFPGVGGNIVAGSDVVVDTISVVEKVGVP